MTKQKFRIGIITHYYKSVNYGGNLQAFALCTFINEFFPNVKAEQISYDIYTYRKKNYDRYSLYAILKKIYSISVRRFNRAIRFSVNRNLKIRRETILEFNLSKIPHSTKIYNKVNIQDCNAEYDMFITGSDQVWHPAAYCPAYFLDFVEQGKVKISYAASISKDTLSESERRVFKNTLTDYTAVSVREKDTVKLLEDIVDIKPEWTLDPTLLLSSKKWDTVASDRLINESYLFCCFLGGNTKQRLLAEKYAKEKKLKIVTLPYLTGEYRKCDTGFGDEKLFNISPSDFISLIKYANCIFTDSFHVTVFSGIYEKEYFVFKRDEAKGAEVRIKSLLFLYQTEERFCENESKECLEYILQRKPIDYTRELFDLKNMRRKSIDFLKMNIEKAEALQRKNEK